MALICVKSYLQKPPRQKPVTERQKTEKVDGKNCKQTIPYLRPLHMNWKNLHDILSLESRVDGREGGSVEETVAEKTVEENCPKNNSWGGVPS